MGYEEMIGNKNSCRQMTAGSSSILRNVTQIIVIGLEGPSLGLLQLWNCPISHRVVVILCGDCPLQLNGFIDHYSVSTPSENQTEKRMGKIIRSPIDDAVEWKRRIYREKHGLKCLNPLRSRRKGQGCLAIWCRNLSANANSVCGNCPKIWL